MDIFGMDPSTLALVCFIIGVLLIAAELATPGFFIGAIGTAFFVMGFLLLFLPIDYINSPIFPLIGLAVAGISMVASIMFYRRLGRTQPTTTTITESNVGKIGVVTVDVEPGVLKGKVRIQHQIWSATADESIPKGTKVRVIDWDGVHVIVEKAEEENLEKTTEKEEVEA
jgi:membrane protein implicated in regulation of membrane protease activity